MDEKPVLVFIRATNDNGVDAKRIVAEMEKGHYVLCAAKAKHPPAAPVTVLIRAGDGQDLSDDMTYHWKLGHYVLIQRA